MNTPVPIVVRPAQEEVQGDKIWIDQIIIDSSRQHRGPTSVRVVCRPYAELPPAEGETEPTRVYADETVILHEPDLFLIIGVEPKWQLAMGAVYAAVQEWFAERWAELNPPPEEPGEPEEPPAEG